MIRIGVTQRVDVVQAHGERRDALDQQWARLLESLDADVLPIPNGLRNPGDWAARQSIQGLLLSGGNDLSHLPNAANSAPERDATERELLHWAAGQAVPVLGVCRGLQMMNHHCGGKLVRVSGHVASRHPVRTLADLPWLGTYCQVNSFHDWGVMPEDLGTDLIPLVTGEDGTIEAFRHRDLPWVAIMWHPEREARTDELDIQLMRHVFLEGRA